MPRKYPEAFRARAVRMVRDRIEQEEGVSQYRAVGDIAPKLGVSAGTLGRWVEQADFDAGTQPGVASDAAGIKRLRRENAELRRVNEILKTASAFFARGARPPLDEMIAYIDTYRDQFGVEYLLHHVAGH